MGTYCAWTGSLDLFHELHGNVVRALDWIDTCGDSDGDGFIDYQTHSKVGLRNQGWKDSGNAIVMEDSQLAEPPIALPEVQGEVYLAWSMIADLYRRDGDAQRAQELLARAARLKEAFTKQFWLEEESYLSLCRQADGRFSRSISSNPAHALWTGIVDDDHVRHVVERIMQPDMFSGWGVRTLASTDRSYNPIDYQVGSIWPHDNAFIVAGLFRTGYVEQGAKIFSGLIDAATQFDQYRLPETFAGYDRNYANAPVHYPVACSPQAWASGAIPYMLQMSLGLNADGFERTLRVQRPHLPDWLHWANVRNIQIAGGSVDLRYQRSDEHTLVTVLEQTGDIHVSVEY
jgi:glycogen debranching enzyme